MAEVAPVRIASTGLSAEINPLGAELFRLTDGEGRELLWHGDPAWWGSRAPILFPIVGTLRADRYRLDGQEYALPRHGFARRRRFDLIDHSPTAATFRLTADEETRAAWPFDFTLDMRFAVEGQRLGMEARITNSGDGVMPSSFGFHPALLWPLPYGGARADHVIRFIEAEPAAVRRLDGDGLLDPAARPTPMDGYDVRLDDALFAEDALIFDQLSSRRLVYGVPGRPGVAISFPDMPHLGIWAKAGAPYLCIEPWQGHADPASHDGDLRTKPGTIPIPPGKTHRFAMEIALLPAGDWPLSD